MARKPAAEPGKRKSHVLSVRLTTDEYHKLKELRDRTPNYSSGELVRRILSNRPVRVRIADTRYDPIMEELAVLRRELRSIGVNINQVTRNFNEDKAGPRKIYHYEKIGQLYRDADLRMQKLLALISALAERWLREST